MVEQDGRRQDRGGPRTQASGLDAVRRYLLQARIPLSLTAGGIPDDQPLLVVNRGFERLTGYPAVEAIGRNCRFLQGPHRSQRSREEMAHFLRDDGRDTMRAMIVNQRRDGSPFINLVFLAKLRDLQGSLRFVVGAQFDASHTHAAELQGYDQVLGRLFDGLGRPGDHGVVLRGSFEALANATATVAQAKLILADL